MCIRDSLSALGLGIKNSVDLAIKQANDSNAIPGWKLQLAAMDDQATPDVGKNAATSLSSDDQVVGVVGTLNSSVAQSVTPVLQPAHIVQISPANTNPTLTQGQDAANPARPYDNYFRTCTTDAVCGAGAEVVVVRTGRVGGVLSLGQRRVRVGRRDLDDVRGLENRRDALGHGRVQGADDAHDLIVRGELRSRVLADVRRGLVILGGEYELPARDRVGVVGLLDREIHRVLDAETQCRKVTRERGDDTDLGGLRGPR